jgi:hypothetical protein
MCEDDTLKWNCIISWEVVYYGYYQAFAFGISKSLILSFFKQSSRQVWFQSRLSFPYLCIAQNWYVFVIKVVPLIKCDQL